MLFVLSQLPKLDSTSRWMLGIVSGLTIVYAVTRPFRRRKDPLARQPSSLAGQRAVEREMSNLLVELSEMARQVSAQLDTRAAKLELLIKEADEKIASLKSAGADAGFASAGGARAALEAMTLKRAEPEVDPRHAEIYALADQGRSSREIAQQLRRPDGEVELILALRETR